MPRGEPDFPWKCSVAEGKRGKGTLRRDAWFVIDLDERRKRPMRLHQCYRFGGLALGLAALGLSCVVPRSEFPGFLYILADSNIIEITSQGAAVVRSGVQTAAISPDGGLLLVSEKGKTSLIDTTTGDAKSIADRPARRLGWNSDGSRFFLVTAPETNQIEVGDRLGNVTIVYRGPHRPIASEGAEPTTIYGEISGSLFLDANTLVFSAYEGVISPTRTDQDLSANKVFMIDLADPEAGLRSTKFPADERWTFADVDSRTGIALVVVGNKRTGEIRPFLCPPFKDWEEMNLAAPVPGTFFQSANGVFSVAFEVGQGNACGLTVAVDARKRSRAVFTIFDEEMQTAETGPDAGWGDNIIGPAVYPDGGAAAALVYEWGKEWRVVFLDIASGTSRTVWTQPASKDGVPNANDDILIWMR
jgi:hypothetical protein